MAASPLEAFREASREARFKQANGDFVFRAPGVGAHHYLVSATQKAEIERLLPPRLAFDRYTIPLLVVYIVFFQFYSWLDDAGVDFWWPGFVSGFVGVFVFLEVSFLIQQQAAFKRIGPALVGARYTDKRIAWRERTETLASLLPISGIIALGVAGALGAIGIALALLNVPTGSGLGRIFWRGPGWLGLWWGIAAYCAFAAGYFSYLAALKVVSRQRPPTVGAGAP